MLTVRFLQFLNDFLVVFAESMKLAHYGEWCLAMYPHLSTKTTNLILMKYGIEITLKLIWKISVLYLGTGPV
jgi:hypothetical protein